MAPEFRLATRADAEAIQRIYRPIVSETAISFETTVPSVSEIRQRIESTTEQYPWLVYEQDGAVQGYTKAGPHSGRGAYQWTVHLSVYVADHVRNEGIGSALYTSLFSALRLQNFVTACAVISLPNEASVRFHERHGFEPVGVLESIGYKHGEWRDVGWWQRSIRPNPENPTPPMPVTELVGTSQWTEAMDTDRSQLNS